jgi:hypothetical protein
VIGLVVLEFGCAIFGIENSTHVVLKDWISSPDGCDHRPILKCGFKGSWAVGLDLLEPWQHKCVSSIQGLELRVLANASNLVILVHASWENEVLLSILEGLVQATSKASEIIVVVVEGAVNKLLLRKAYGSPLSLNRLVALQASNHCERVGGGALLLLFHLSQDWRL